MSTVMNQRDQFERQLDANPHDWEARRLYADWLDECGEEVASNGQRWQAVEEKAPAITTITESGVETAWWFNAAIGVFKRSYPRACIGMEIGIGLRGLGSWIQPTKIYWPCSGFKTRQSAELALAERLHALGIVAGTKQAVLDDEVVRENEFAPLDAMRVHIVEKE